MTDQSKEAQDKKIFIDEDWKAQVEAEKDASTQPGEKAEAGPSPPEPEEDHPLPPPTLVDLAGSLAVQAMIALGAMENPLSGKAELRVHQARHLIDVLDMLQKKTEGNRTADETAAFEHLLHELRLGFLAVQGGTPPR